METLTPTDGRKSFYGKCEMIEDGDTVKLQSYNTIVAEYNTKTKKMKVNGWYSMTTARHINSFLYYWGFVITNKQGMENWDESTKPIC